ncbi:hypothetical protein LOD99_15275 [Oopsacas minuta]|uniref:Uncharacterized protein n=1 Tax=Oopsacas minuta TaxID=111878 RepID=A0AAV7KC81_9METZ|nr:hypothetical protein LOD99_15275 [Oopsacas minuta]
MGCCPSNSFNQPLPIPPLQTNSNTSAQFHPSNSISCSPDNPPPYSVQPLSGHKSISLPQSNGMIPLRGWGERPVDSAWPATSHPNEVGREQQLQTQVQFLQQFINILQQESTDRVNPLGAIEAVESIGDIDELDQLPPLNQFLNTNTSQQIHSHNNVLLPPALPDSPILPSFPAPVTSLTHTDLTPVRLPPIDTHDLDLVPESTHDQEESHSLRPPSRKKRKKKRRRRATVAPLPHSPEYPILTLQRPFTSPNLRATLASPLGSDQTFF